MSADAIDWKDGAVFIETQLPVSRLSKEAQKERKAGASQTLTGLGKWWGRKPLVLVRATILGCLLPSTSSPSKDRGIFLQLMRMDDASLCERQKAALKPEVVHRELLADPARAAEAAHWLAQGEKGRWGWNPARSAFELRLQKGAWLAEIAPSLDDRLANALRPEEMDDTPYPSELWDEIDAHLGVRANSLSDLIEKLGMLRFGRRPKVGDCFAGGGSIPFEAARIGCDAYASDLNPVAGLLTWGALNIVGGGPAVKAQVEADQEKWLSAVDAQVTSWGIEHDGKGNRADAYLYCAESKCPACEWMVPLSPSWEVSQKQGLGMKLTPDASGKRFGFELVKAKEVSAPTVEKQKLCCPNCGSKTAIATLRGDYVVQVGDNKETGNKLRPWALGDFKPQPGDVFQERLYCVRWVELDPEGNPTKKRFYAAPTSEDLAREAQVEALLSQKFKPWQADGFIPSMQIMPGDETTRLTRERGWTHWSHLFNPRQLLFFGLASSLTLKTPEFSLLINRGLDWNSKLVHWLVSRPGEGNANTFANQALNTMWNYASRAGDMAFSALTQKINSASLAGAKKVILCDAKTISEDCDLWVTDPPYADAVNYHELSEFFLAWMAPYLVNTFPASPHDSRRELAVGGGESFSKTMVEIYGNLAQKMPNQGFQVLMFTHQDSSVWAELAMIIWSAGLKVSSAWIVSTERDSALKEGSYVQGTVCLILKKRTGGIDAWDSDLSDLPNGVKRQIEALQGMDSSNSTSEARDFSQADFQLAAYAAALKIVTGFASYEGVEPGSVFDEDDAYRDEAQQKITRVLLSAQAAADGLLVPSVFVNRKSLWESLLGVEKFWIKSLLEIYSGSSDISFFQTIAKGFDFGAGDSYHILFSQFQSNRVEMKSPSEWDGVALAVGGAGWRGSLTRHILKAVQEVSSSGDGMSGVCFLQITISALSDKLQTVQTILRLIESAGDFNLGAVWSRDARAAGVLANTLAQLNPATIGSFIVPELGVVRKAKPAERRLVAKGPARAGRVVASGGDSTAGKAAGVDRLLRDHRDKNDDGVL